MVYQIAICDNDDHDLEALCAGVQKWRNIQKEADVKITSFDEAARLQMILESECFNLLILDIMMPGINGIEIGNYVRKKYRETKLVYVTSSTDYAMAAYSISALGYLTKPIQQDLLNETLDMAYTLYVSRARPVAVLNGKDGIHRVAVDDIMYIENDVRDMICSMRDGSRIFCSHRNYSFEKAAEEIISMTNGFVQPHKSYFVNMAYIQTLQTDYMQIDNGAILPITRRRLTEVRSAYLDYVSKENFAL